MPAIAITDLTTSELEGTGVFDKLMQTVKAHIEDEYCNERIRGPEYSTIYLAALQTTMDQSIRFLLDKNNALLIEKQIELIEQQILKAQQDVLVAQQDVLVAQQQVIKIQKEVELITAQILKMTKEEALIDAQIARSNAEILNIPKQGDLLVEQKLLTIAQQAKTGAEQSLLAQKLITELAQVDDANIDPGSVVGRQTALYAAQSESYDKDAQQKAAKLMIDSWSVRHSLEPSGNPASAFNSLEDDDVKIVVDKLIAGVP